MVWLSGVWLAGILIGATGYNQAGTTNVPTDYIPSFQLNEVNLTENLTLAVRCTDSISNQSRYTVGFLPALHGVGQPKHYVGAFLYALQTVNNEWQGDDRCLLYMYSDTGGDTQKTIGAMTQQLYNGCIAFIGVENNCALEATIAAAWQLPLISYVSST